MRLFVVSGAQSARRPPLSQNGQPRVKRVHITGGSPQGNVAPIVAARPSPAYRQVTQDGRIILRQAPSVPRPPPGPAPLENGHQPAADPAAKPYSYSQSYAPTYTAPTPAANPVDVS